MNLERRGFELRAVSDEGATLEGVAMPFNSRGTVGRFTEEFMPGSLKYGDVLVNLQHNPDRIVARTDGGLTLAETREALLARIELPDTGEGRDARVLVSKGVLRGLSVEFRAIKDRWQGTHRIIEEAMLDSIGIVARPAYAGATIGPAGEMRSVDYLEMRAPMKRIFRCL